VDLSWVAGHRLPLREVDLSWVAGHRLLAHVDDLAGRQPSMAHPLSQGQPADLSPGQIESGLQARRGGHQQYGRSALPGADQGQVPTVVSRRGLLLVGAILFFVDNQ